MKEDEMAMKQIEEKGHKRMAEYQWSLQYHALLIIHYTPVDVSYGNEKMATPLTPTLISLLPVWDLAT